HASSIELRGPVQHKLLTGEYRTCLLYSEPGAGSDLAGLQTRADRDGDEWVISGHKVWVSAALQATHGLLPARTNWDVPKHKGITFFLLPMDQPGLDISPIKQMTGDSVFNEVVLNDVRVRDGLRISEIDGGWPVLNNALAVERMMLGGAIERSRVEEGEFRPEDPKRTVDLVAMAKETGFNQDPVLRQEIARMHTLRRVLQWNAERAHAGMTDMNTATVLKLSMSRILHGSARIYAEMLGTEAMLVETGSPRGHEANRLAMRAFVTSIGAGSDQIQRNLIAERVLGLPRDPSADYNVPFRDVPKSDGVRRFSERDA
ncbi:MAG TPA: acyl-CoA dehydrogenase family protein, partial [Chloroflexota bacterium]|nr:acyl-CoA dehydrogenase family protein [Chloroflexota bacterium]